METKYLDARIKKYESWAKDGVIRHKEKLELIELKAIKEQLRLAVVSGSSLSEAILIIGNLMAYGKIHTVKGVRYVEGSHEEIIEKAERWLWKVRKNYR